MPGAVEIETTQRVVEARRNRGAAGIVQVDGKMIDRPVVLAAERLLATTR